MILAKISLLLAFFISCVAIEHRAAAQEPSDFSDRSIIKVGVINYVRPNPFEPLQVKTAQTLKRHFGEDRVDVRVYTWSDLKKAVNNAEVDFFLGSAGFFWRMNSPGIHHVTSATSLAYPDPNQNDGATFVVAADRTDLTKLQDLRGKSLLTNTSTGFTGLQIPMGVIAEHGYNPESFFKDITYLGDGRGLLQSFEKLLNHEGDVAFIRLCYYEKWLDAHPEFKGRFRILNEQTGPSEVCKRSTPLYPSWTIGSTTSVSPTLLREVTKTLLMMDATEEEKLYWSVANDFSAVDNLFRTLKIGPYQYLREWTFTRFWKEYSTIISVLTLLAFGLLLHSVRTSVLIRQRTAELRQSLERLEQLRQKARESSARINRLEKLSSVGQLSSIFAHEMRQPLGAISLYSYALRRALSRNSPNKAQLIQLAEKISSQSERADAIVTKVREWAKSSDPKRDRIEWDAAIRMAVKELAATDRYDTPVHIELNQKLTFEADPLGIELVIFNLLKNALQAAENHKTRSPGIVVKVFSHEDASVLSVRNIGIPVSDKEWEAVHHAGVSSKEDGLGLGIGIVRNVIEQHGGRLDFVRHDDGLEALARIPLLSLEQ